MAIDLHIAKKYIKHLTSSSGSHRLHSPFAYEFYTNVLHDNRTYYSFRAIEKRRNHLLNDDTSVKVTELGAGSLVQASTERSIRNIAKSAARKAKYGRLLFRVVNYFNPKNILELGTSLGISGAYLASARSKTKITTLEGWPEMTEIAKETFKVLHLENVKVVSGNFDDTLEPVLQDIPSLDLAFIDGNHRKEPTLRYFEQCLTKTHNESILIFDDIYWTPEMEEAWEEIKAHPSVRLTIDIFYYGFVFFKKEFKEKQHFKFKY